jgi:pSer/pThr/pTyr-binding forkhead associated (FHA) protein
MAKFQFVMRSGPTVGKVYPLEAQELSIGRDDANRIVINDAEVSRRHARMELRGSAYVIQDLGSTNGTFVNGTRLSGIQVLNPGDTVTLGEGIVLAYESATDLNATILSTQPSQTVIERPTSAPAPAPVPRPIPTPVYSGHVPASPAPASSVPVGQVPMPPETAPAKKGGSKTVIIIVVIAVVLILCLCVGVPFLADALRLDCMIPFKWFFNIIGPMFGYGLCP